ncbi:MAG TPA: glycoside hydrolase family 32 protein [Candidatus Acidoferrales bacterium]|nr:glycoside hydrolase family 32 protein [Candidatus Acidoferrales bacterium]
MNRRAWTVLVLAVSCAGQGPAPYDERFRPQYHFSPRQNWTNDPNGLVYFDGEYHLFYQYNPFGDRWGHMSWGHAVSGDLLHWRELPVALPEENGIMIFTGSTVVDRQNSSGLCTGGRPCLIAVYTGHTPPAPGRAALETQNIAYSNDRGRTWTKYAGNPVLDLGMADFRDPHVFWSEAARAWTMAVALPGQHKVLIYRSADLKRWQRVSEFGPAGATGGQWECPTLAEVPVEGRAGASRWVLKVGLNPGGLQGGSGEQYFAGSFDGTRFINENPPATTLWTDYGKDCYCALPFNGSPPGAAPVMLGWMNDWQYAGDVPTKPWRGQMTIPRRLQLKQTAEGLRLAQEPVDLESLRGAEFAWRGSDAASLNRALRDKGPRGTSWELRAKVRPGAAGEVGWRVLSGEGKYTLVGYNAAGGEFFVDRTHSGDTGFQRDFPARTTVKRPANGTLDFVILADRSTLEVFAQGGLVAITTLVYPPPEARAVEFSAEGGPPAEIRVQAWELATTWPRF